ncbi:hypothetical protein H6S82_10655 [Planktothrix sp. FACHB-1355]|uniref:Uncharacterized protein n=1 Tax=Aerosakkonema funiforme FACHB-1375 TaxID=2949571 RepID=A0A926V9F6_9CYAN|nr:MULTISPECIES: hypothetical protein [Oscillatoriales]MBD2179642.1 hypothetical protein [Aerosakkonema funiforme FACHB-1375]MBD3559321.1 hypothetical protein [Planktothrix sp. FACHB-1355]
MRFRIIAIATLIATIGSAANPSLSQTDLNAQLNAELKQAVCAQQWRRAIQIIDRMRVRVPQMESQLVSYRTQMQTLARSRTRIENWPPAYCTAAPTTPASTTAPTLTPTPAATPATGERTSAITGSVAANEISAPFRGRRVRGIVVNNTNNPVTQVKVTYSIVRTTGADGQPIPEQVLETGTAAIRGTIAPGGQANFETLVNSQIRGNPKIVSVEWKNTLDNSDGANPPRRRAQ